MREFLRMLIEGISKAFSFRIHVCLLRQERLLLTQGIKYDVNAM